MDIKSFSPYREIFLRKKKIIQADPPTPKVIHVLLHLFFFAATFPLSWHISIGGRLIQERVLACTAHIGYIPHILCILLRIPHIPRIPLRSLLRKQPNLLGSVAKARLRSYRCPVLGMFVIEYLNNFLLMREFHDECICRI